MSVEGNMMISTATRSHIKKRVWLGIGVGLLLCGVVTAVVVKKVFAQPQLSNDPMQNVQNILVSPGEPVRDAWIYPDAPGALDMLRNGLQLFAIKAEFLTIAEDGALKQINESEEAPNGYSEQNMMLFREHSQRQYVTISGRMAGTQAAMQNPQTIPQIVAFADKANVDVELDWEEFGQWSPAYYQQFKTFLGELHGQLNARGHQLMVDGPPIFNAESQSWYQWKYEEIAPLTDSVVMMIYDNQYDYGAGEAIAPEDWSLACMHWLKQKTDGKGIAGIASYGYSGTKGSWDINVQSSDMIKNILNGAVVSRNADGELVAQLGDTFYTFADEKTMQKRLEQVKQAGIKRLSVWSLGGNPWFNVTR